MGKHADSAPGQLRPEDASLKPALIPPSGLLTPVEAANYLRISVRMLRLLKRRGAIQYVALTKRRVVYRTADLETYIASRLATDGPARARRLSTQRAPRHAAVESVYEALMAKRQQRRNSKRG